MAARPLKPANITASSAYLPILAAVLICAVPAHSQVLEISAESAQLAGLSLKALSGRIAIREGQAQASFTVADRSISQRDLTMTVHAKAMPRGWRLALQPLSLPIQLSIEPNSAPATAEISLQAEIFGHELSQVDKALLAVELADLRYSDQTGTVALEGVSLKTDLQLLAMTGQSLLDAVAHPWELRMQSQQGELLWGPAYLNLSQYPLTMTLTGQWPRHTPSRVDISSLHLSQEGLLHAEAQTQAHVQWDTSHPTTPITDSPLRIESAQIDLYALDIPAAYQSLFRTALAGTLLGNLQTEGYLSGYALIEDNAPVALDLSLHDLSLEDERNRALTLDQLSGEIHWRAHPPHTHLASQINWQSAALNGIPMGASSFQFAWQGDQLQLLEASRIPILDGALRVDSLSIRNLFDLSREISLDGALEPLSLTELTQALGWPALAGTLTGRAPGVRYRDQILTVNGPLEADIFGGQVIGRNLQIRQPFSRWPSVTADIDLQGLDLSLLSSTLEIGAISGRIGGYIHDLELFAWQPVAFEALIATDEESPEPRRISVRAINSIANIGGTAGTGVAAALQGGLLRFFDSYRYRKLGLRCTLKDNICLMSGANDLTQRSGERYTLLEGAGIPRLDIIGYAGRVNWSQLIEQVADQIQSGGTPIRVP